MSAQVWEIDGEDLIVARNERDMQALFLDYHGFSIRGHERRLIPPSEEIRIGYGDETETVPASSLSGMRGYMAATR